jgi:hypothetical protein
MTRSFVNRIFVDFMKKRPPLSRLMVRSRWGPLPLAGLNARTAAAKRREYGHKPGDIDKSHGTNYDKEQKWTPRKEVPILSPSVHKDDTVF